MLTISDRFKNMFNSKNRDRCWHTFTHKYETLANLTRRKQITMKSLFTEAVFAQCGDKIDKRVTCLILFFAKCWHNTVAWICSTCLSLREELLLLRRLETKYQRQMSWHNRYTVTYITWPPIVDFPASKEKIYKISLLLFCVTMMKYVCYMFQRNRTVMVKTKLLPTWPINIILTCSLLSSSSSTSFLELAFFTSGLASSFSASSFTSVSSVSLFSATTKHFLKNLEVSGYGVRKGDQVQV